MENTTIISPSKSTNFTKYDFFWKESESDKGCKETYIFFKSRMSLV